MRWIFATKGQVASQTSIGAGGQAIVNRLWYAVRSDNQDAALRRFLRGFHNLHPAFFQFPHHLRVMDDRAKGAHPFSLVEQPVDHADRFVHAEAETGGLGPAVSARSSVFLDHPADALHDQPGGVAQIRMFRILKMQLLQGDRRAENHLAAPEQTHMLILRHDAGGKHLRAGLGNR